MEFVWEGWEQEDIEDEFDEWAESDLTLLQELLAEEDE